MEIAKAYLIPQAMKASGIEEQKVWADSWMICEIN
jgi:ATP-dependent Lon protease